MKIFQIVHAFPPYNIAGSEVYTYNLSKDLAKRHKVLIFHRIKDMGCREYEVIHSKEDGFDIYAVNNTFRYCNSFEQTYRNETIAKSFAKFLDNVQPDIVHIQHLLFLSTTFIEEIKKRGIPIVFTLHDYWLICPLGQLLKRNLKTCEDYNFSDCVKCLEYQLSIRKRPSQIYQFLRERIPDFLLQLIKRIYLSYAKLFFLSKEEAKKQVKLGHNHIKEICSMVDLFIAPSHFLRNKFIEFGIPDEKIKFNLHGINTNLFRDFKRKESNRVRFGFIGIILPAKGLDVLINAFNNIKGDQVDLRIYGRLFPYQGFEYYPRYVKRLVKNANIQFMGRFDHNNVAKIFSEIDILVVPSIWYENSPFVIQEAILAGIPVIASDIGGIPELVKNGENGLLFKPNDADNLYEKISLILDNPALIENLRQNIKLLKSIEVNAREIENIYMDLMANVENH